MAVVVVVGGVYTKKIMLMPKAFLSHHPGISGRNNNRGPLVLLQAASLLARIVWCLGMKRSPSASRDRSLIPQKFVNIRPFPIALP